MSENKSTYNEAPECESVFEKLKDIWAEKAADGQLKSAYVSTVDEGTFGCVYRYVHRQHKEIETVAKYVNAIKYDERLNNPQFKEHAVNSNDKVAQFEAEISKTIRTSERMSDCKNYFVTVFKPSEGFKQWNFMPCYQSNLSQFNLKHHQLSEILTLIADIMRCVSKARTELGLLYSDLKPENILCNINPYFKNSGEKAIQQSDQTRIVDWVIGDLGGFCREKIQQSKWSFADDCNATYASTHFHHLAKNYRIKGFSHENYKDCNSLPDTVFNHLLQSFKLDVLLQFGSNLTGTQLKPELLSRTHVNKLQIEVYLHYFEYKKNWKVFEGDTHRDLNMEILKTVVEKLKLEIEIFQCFSSDVEANLQDLHTNLNHQLDPWRQSPKQ